MPTYRELDIRDGTVPGDPPAQTVAARRVATKHSAHQQFKAQDRIIGSGRRILGHLGMGPVADTFIPDTDPTQIGGDPVYPDDDTPYTVARRNKACVTPGSTLTVGIVALPSGHTQVANGSNWDPDRIYGVVIVTVILTNSAAQTVTMAREIEIPGSQLQYGQKPADDGHGFFALDEFAAFHIPDDFHNVPAEMAKWSGPYLLAEIQVQHLASPRVVDLIVYEIPQAITKDISTGNWPAHLYALDGEPYGNYPLEFPVEQLSTSDPSLGMEHLIATANETAWQLGPELCFWSCWDQGTATIQNTLSNSSHDGQHTNGVGDDEAPPIDITATSFHHWLDSGWTTFEATNPGLSLGCGAYGRHYRTSDQTLILPNSGVVECVVGVYLKMDAGLSTGTVRFWVSPYSWIDVFIPTSSDSYAWHYVPALLQCGTGPEDDHHLQLYAQVGGGGQTMSIRYWGAWYRSDP